MRDLLLGASLVAALATGAAAQPIADDDRWERTLERVVPAVVVLRASATRPFDTERTKTYTGTGFVVDAERGIILTNRHVVGPGPVVAEAVFQNHEEVEVRAVYRDPVHDFGFFRFDPSEVRFMPAAELELAPERARVGAEVRVIGNDAGEKLSILAGTLARLDREAPQYGRGRYNDFNTFYLQAASNTSGGSSGSPVVDRTGRVVALNAGGRTRAASSFFLPLERVARALEAVREGRPVSRGTLQTVFTHRPYDELRRLGLRPETEARVRRAHPDAIGMLVVDEVVPGGPGDGQLEPGDVLVSAVGRTLTTFLPLEAALDDGVGGEIALSLERGGEPLEVRLTVADLHAVTPSEFLELGRGVVHALSLQQARNHAVSPGGVYVAAPGYALGRAGIPRAAVITAVGDVPTPDLDAFEAAVAAAGDGAPLPLRYVRLSSRRTEAVAVVRMDRRWFPMRRCVREDTSGRWPCRDIAPPPQAPRRAPASARLPERGDRRARKLAASLCLVEFHIPYRIDGVHGDRFSGAGVVVDAARGLVVTDRDTVPIALGDALLTFGGSVEVPARVVYLHPTHNLAVLQYDPARIGETPVRDAALHDRSVEPGDRLWLVGLTANHQLISEEVRVSRIQPAQLPLPRPPRFRESNVELVALSTRPATDGGVLVDRRGRVVALWQSFSAHVADKAQGFFAGLPAGLVLDVVTPLRAGRPVDWRGLGVEWQPLDLAEARLRGLSDEAARRLEEHDAGAGVLTVRRLAADAPAAELLEEGDLLLAAGGAPASRVREVERASRRDAVALQVLRNGRELELEVPTLALAGRGTERVLQWAGALLQRPHRALATQRAIPREGVYVAWFWWGSPAHRYGLRSTRRITEVDGQPTPDLDAFAAAVADRTDRGPVRLQTVDLDGRVEVITLKLDLQYWPTFELRFGAEGWQRMPR